MLTKIKINGLFNKFNYVIELKKEDITIFNGSQWIWKNNYS